MKKPLIGISCSQVNYTEPGAFWGTHADGIQQYYAEAVRKAGGIPVLLPITTDKAEVKELVEHLDGVILTGGQDVDPLLYNEDPHPQLGSVLHERDVFEIMLARFADEKKLPMLGICRGCQIMNVTFGGTLYQHIPDQVKGAHCHGQAGSPLVPSHIANINKDSVLSTVFGEKTLVNSLHHQAVKDVAEGFFAAATANDGVIEAIEKNDRFVLGVQWHPEWLTAGGSDKALDIFRMLIAAAQ